MHRKKTEINSQWIQWNILW